MVGGIRCGTGEAPSTLGLQSDKKAKNVIFILIRRGVSELLSQRASRRNTKIAKIRERTGAFGAETVIIPPEKNCFCE